MSRADDALQRAELLLEAGRTADALLAVDGVLRDDPHHLGALLLRSVVLLEAGSCEEALAAALEAARADPEEAFAQLQVAVAADRVPGERRTAWDAASRACALAPHDPQMHVVMASVALSWRRLDVAERALLEALRLDPQHPQARHDLAVVHLRRGAHGAAASDLVAVLREDPQDPVARSNLEVAVLRRLLPAHLVLWALTIVVFSARDVVPEPQTYVLTVPVLALAAVVGVWWSHRAGRLGSPGARVVVLRVAASSWAVRTWFWLLAVVAVAVTLGAVVPGADVHGAAEPVAQVGVVLGALVPWALVIRRRRAVRTRA